MNHKSFLRFSLLEILISVIAVIVIGIFTANIFIYSHNANKTAHNMDMAVSMATSSIENFKAGYNTGSMIFYDENWGCLERLTEDARFALYSDILNEDGTDFQNIHVRVVDVADGSPVKDKPPLVDYTAAMYKRNNLEEEVPAE